MAYYFPRWYTYSYISVYLQKRSNGAADVATNAFFDALSLCTTHTHKYVYLVREVAIWFTRKNTRQRFDRTINGHASVREYYDSYIHMYTYYVGTYVYTILYKSNTHSKTLFKPKTRRISKIICIVIKLENC